MHYFDLFYALFHALFYVKTPTVSCTPSVSKKWTPHRTDTPSVSPHRAATLISSNNGRNFTDSSESKRRFLNNLFTISKQCICCMKILFQTIKSISAKKRPRLLFFFMAKIECLSCSMRISNCECDVRPSGKKQAVILINMTHKIFFLCVW